LPPFRYSNPGGQALGMAATVSCAALKQLCETKHARSEQTFRDGLGCGRHNCSCLRSRIGTRPRKCAEPTAGTDLAERCQPQGPGQTRCDASRTKMFGCPIWSISRARRQTTHPCRRTWCATCHKANYTSRKATGSSLRLRRETSGLVKKVKASRREQRQSCSSRRKAGSDVADHKKPGASTSPRQGVGRILRKTGEPQIALILLDRW
jgi:hypothetical protein